MDWPKLEARVVEQGAGMVAAEINILVSEDNVAAAVDGDSKAKALYTLLLAAAQLSVELRQDTEDAHGQYRKLLAKAELAGAGTG